MSNDEWRQLELKKSESAAVEKEAQSQESQQTKHAFICPTTHNSFTAATLVSLSCIFVTILTFFAIKQLLPFCLSNPNNLFSSPSLSLSLSFFLPPPFLTFIHNL